MNPYQQEFLEFAIEQNVLRFGDFTLKSGRKSPYFFNIGLFYTGNALAQLGRFYAQAIQNSGIEFDVLFGPAYKGIPLVTSAAIALADHHQYHIPYCFNRKEAKDHGEGGITVGAPLTGRVLVVDDVISAGTAIREASDLILAEDAKLVGVVVALNRQEQGQKKGLSALKEIEQTYDIQVASIVNLDNLIHYLEQQPEQRKTLKAVQKYRKKYGA